MKKLLLLFLFVTILVAVSHAVYVDYIQVNANQFTTNSYKLTVKSGAIVTNLNLKGTATVIQNATATNVGIVTLLSATNATVQLQNTPLWLLGGQFLQSFGNQSYMSLQMDENRIGHLLVSSNGVNTNELHIDSGIVTFQSNVVAGAGAQFIGDGAGITNISASNTNPIPANFTNNLIRTTNFTTDVKIDNNGWYHGRGNLTNDSLIVMAYNVYALMASNSFGVVMPVFAVSGTNTYFSMTSTNGLFEVLASDNTTPLALFAESPPRMVINPVDGATVPTHTLQVRGTIGGTNFSATVAGVAATNLTSPGAGANSEKFGLSSLAAGQDATALGNAATAPGLAGTAVGRQANSGAESYNTAIGYLAATVGGAATALGVNAQAIKTNSLALGYSSSASATGSVAVGVSASAAHWNATAIGPGVATTQTNQVMLGLPGGSVVAPNMLYIGASNISLNATGSVIGATSFLDTSNNTMRGNASWPLTYAPPASMVFDWSQYQQTLSCTTNLTISFGNTNNGNGLFLEVCSPGATNWTLTVPSFAYDPTVKSNVLAYTIQALLTNFINFFRGSNGTTRVLFTGPANTNLLNLAGLQGAGIPFSISSGGYWLDGTNGNGTVVLSTSATLTTPTINQATETSPTITGGSVNGSFTNNAANFHSYFILISAGGTNTLDCSLYSYVSLSMNNSSELELSNIKTNGVLTVDFWNNQTTNQNLSWNTNSPCFSTNRTAGAIVVPAGQGGQIIFTMTPGRQNAASITNTTVAVAVTN